MSTETLRSSIQTELKAASASLKKYEDAYLAAKEGDDKEFIKDSVTFYRKEVQTLRGQLFQTKAPELDQ